MFPQRRGGPFEVALDRQIHSRGAPGWLPYVGGRTSDTLLMVEKW